MNEFKSPTEYGMEAKMIHLYFHYSSADAVIIDRFGAQMLDLIEARDYAFAMARNLMAQAFGVGSFRGWYVHVMDEDDDEILVVPFETVIGGLH